MSQATPQALDLIGRCCQWDPAKRPTALQALQHPFFQVWLTIQSSRGHDSRVCGELVCQDQMKMLALAHSQHLMTFGILSS